MKSFKNSHGIEISRRTNLPARLLAAGVFVLLLSACKHGDDGTQVAGWAMISPTQRHPIIVTQKPTDITIRVPRGSQGLSPQQRAQLLEFAERYRAGDGGNSRLVISAPSGSPNEVSAMAAVGEIRLLLANQGFAKSVITVEAYTEERDAHAPIRVSYLRYVADGPKCENWSADLSRQRDNLPHPDFGCANQHNFAAMVANPADLVEPRTMAPRPAARRAATYEKYVKGEATGAQKSEDERSRTKGN